MIYPLIFILLYQISALSALRFDLSSHGASVATPSYFKSSFAPITALLRRAINEADKKIVPARSGLESPAPSTIKQQTVTKPSASAKAQSASRVLAASPSDQAKGKTSNIVKVAKGPEQEMISKKQNGSKPAPVASQNKSPTKQKSFDNKNDAPRLAIAQLKTKVQGRLTRPSQNKAQPGVQQSKLKQAQRKATNQAQPSNQNGLSENDRKSGQGLQNPNPIKQKQRGGVALSNTVSASQKKVSDKNRKPSLGVNNQKISKQNTSLGRKLSKLGPQPKSRTSRLVPQTGGTTSKQASSKKEGKKLCKRGAGGSCLRSSESEMMRQSSSRGQFMDTMYSGSGSLREHGRTTTRYIQDNKTKFALDLLKQTAPVLGGAAACAGVCCAGKVCGLAASSVAAASLGGAAVAAGCIGGVGPECYKGYQSYKAGTAARAEEEQRRTQERVGSLETRVQGTEQNLQNVQQHAHRSATLAEAALQNVASLQNEAIILPPVTQRIPTVTEERESASPSRLDGSSRGRGGRGSPIQGSA